MTHNTYLYLAIMAGVTLAIRVLPLTLIRGQLENRFLRSFLYYVPYVTLAVMTFPAILDATPIPSGRRAGSGGWCRSGLVRRQSVSGIGGLLRRGVPH